MRKEKPLNPLGYLVTDCSHAIPLEGVSPEQLGAGIFQRQIDSGSKFSHTDAQRAVVTLLGFRGDSGDYKNNHWPLIKGLLVKNNCTQPGGFFPRDHGGCIDLGFNEQLITPRHLADRIFESGRNWPQRAFLGHGIDWRVFYSSLLYDVSTSIFKLPFASLLPLRTIPMCDSGQSSCKNRYGAPKKVFADQSSAASAALDSNIRYNNLMKEYYCKSCEGWHLCPATRHTDTDIT